MFLRESNRSTALKTLSLRLRGAKTELEDAGLETDAMAESTSELQEELKALTHGKVDIMLNADTFKSTTQILREMSSAWEDMTDIERASALELMGGKRQSNILASLIENFDVVEDVIDTAANSEGSALAENEKYLDSIQGKLDQLSNATQTMWMNFMDSDVVKFIIELCTHIVKLIDHVGLLESAIGAFVGFKIAQKSIKDAFAEIDAGTFNIQDMIWKSRAKAKAEDTTATDANTEAMRRNTEATRENAGASAQGGSVDAAEAAQSNMSAEAERNETQATMEGVVAKEAAQQQDIEGIATDKLQEQQNYQTAQSQNVENQEQLKAVAAGKAEQVQDGKNIASDRAQAAQNNATAASQAGENASQASSGSGGTGSVGGAITGAVTTAAVSATATKAATSAGTGLLAKIFGSKVGAAVVGGLKGIAISALISVGMNLLGKLFNWVSGKFNEEEEQLEQLQTALSEYENKKKELTGQKDTVDELSKSYKHLSSGVNTATNSNIGLTTEAYQEYLDVCNQIADMFPELIVGYDSQGNAILNLTDKVNGLSTAYDEAAKAAASALLTKENKKAAWKTYTNSEADDITRFEWGDYSKNAQIKAIEVLLSTGKELRNVYDSYTNDISDDEYDEILLRYMPRGMYGAGTTDNITSPYFLMKAVRSTGVDMDAGYDEFLSQLNTTLTNLRTQVTTGTYEVETMLNAYLMNNLTFSDLSNDGKGIVKTIIKNYTPELIEKSGADNIDDFFEWFLSNVVSKVYENQGSYNNLVNISDRITKALYANNRDDYEAASSEFKKLISMWTDEDGNLITDTDDDFVTRYLKQQATITLDAMKNYELRTKIEEDLASQKTVSDVWSNSPAEAKIANDIYADVLKGTPYIKSSVNDTLSQILPTFDGGDGALRVDEITDAYDDFLNGDMSKLSEQQQDAIAVLDALIKLYGTDYDTLMGVLMELDYVLPSLDDVKSFNLASESINEFVDEFQSDVSKIQDAWKDLNSGDMTQSDFLDLAQEFPEIMDGVDFSSSNWMAQAKANLEELNSTTVDDFIEELELMRDAMIDRGEDTAIVDSVLGYAKQYTNLEQVAEELQADTIAGFTEAQEKYKTIMEETNEVLYDGQKVSTSYYESLAEYIDDVDALNACFDANNKQIVTNVDALKELIDAQHEADVQNVKMAKSQAQLRYYELVRELGDNIKALGYLSDASDGAVDSILAQIRVTKSAIVQYQQLEDNLLGATSAFDNFAKAQEQDGQNTYGATYAEMVQTMYDALYETGKVGSAQFWAAVEATVPDSIYKNLTPGPEQIKAIYDYLNDNITPTLTFDEDSFSINYSDIEKFVKKAQEVGVFTGTDATSFGLSSDFIYGLQEGENALEIFAQKMGMTTTQVYAMLSEMDNYTTDGQGLSMLLQLDTSASGQITYVTNELERLYEQRALLAQQGASEDALGTNEAEIYKYESALAGLQKQATAAVKEYAAIENALVDTSKTVMEALPYEVWSTELQLTGDETVAEVLQDIRAYQLKIGEPMVMELEIAQQSIKDELAALEGELSEAEINASVELNEDDLYEIKAGVTSDNLPELERYVELKNAELFIDESLMSSLTTQEQLLTNIDKNVQTIAGVDSPTKDGTDDERRVETKTWQENMYDEIDACKYELEELYDILSSKSERNFGEEQAFKNIQSILDDLSSFKRNIRIGICSEYDAQSFLDSKKQRVELQYSLAGVERDKESQSALTDLNETAQETTSEVEKIYAAYASPEEALEALEKVEDKTRELTAEEALSFGWQLNEGATITVEEAIKRYKQELDSLRTTSLYNPEQPKVDETLVKTYTQLQNEISDFNDIFAQTEEIISDNTEVSQDYKDTLEELGIAETELNECFDSSNSLLVVNAKKLNTLVKNAKNNVATNIKLAKSQARLKYYKLYKEMARLTKGTNQIDGETQDYIQSLYSQTLAIQKTIAQYSMLEAQLLGVSNAYSEIEDAQQIDSANDYGSKAEDMVNILGEAFNTAKLGTQAAQTAIAGLVPESVYDDVDELDEKMQKIYEYFTTGQVSKLFTIEFDDEGNISSVEMAKENVEAFTESLMGDEGSDSVFWGTWDNFTLNPAIDSMEQFAKELGVTKEVAFAYLTELETYDINWLGGNHETLLDQLMGDDFEYNIQKTMQKLTELTKEKAELMKDGIAEEEQGRFDELNNEIIALNGTMDAHRAKAYETWQAYDETDDVLAALDLMDKAATLDEATALELGLTWDGDKTVQEYYNDILAQQVLLGQPTELILQLAADNTQEQLDALKKKLEDNDIELEANVHLNEETGEFEYTKDTSGWSDEDVAILNEYLELTGDLYDINQSLGLGIENMETYAQRTADAVESIDSKLGGDASNAGKTIASEFTNKMFGVAQSSQTERTEDLSRTETSDGVPLPDVVEEDIIILQPEIVTEQSSEQDGAIGDISTDNATIESQTVTATGKPEIDPEAVATNLANAYGQFITREHQYSDTGGSFLYPGLAYEDPAYMAGGNTTDAGQSSSNVEYSGEVTAYVTKLVEVDGGAEVDIPSLTNLDGEVSQYSVAEAVDTSVLNPTGLAGIVSGYNKDPNGVTTTDVNPTGLTGIVSNYAQDINGVNKTNVNPTGLTGYVGQYHEASPDGAITANLKPTGITADVSSYNEIEGGADKTNLNIGAIDATISTYSDDDADISGLAVNGLEATIAKYVDSPNVDTSGVLDNITVRIKTYDDADATLPTLLGANGNGAEDTRTLQQKYDDVIQGMVNSGGDFDLALQVARVTLDELVAYQREVIGDEKLWAVYSETTHEKQARDGVVRAYRVEMFDKFVNEYNRLGGDLTGALSSVEMTYEDVIQAFRASFPLLALGESNKSWEELFTEYLNTLFMDSPQFETFTHADTDDSISSISDVLVDGGDYLTEAADAIETDCVQVENASVHVQDIEPSLEKDGVYEDTLYNQIAKALETSSLDSTRQSHEDLRAIEELQHVFTEFDGGVWFDTTIFRQVLDEAGYASDVIDGLISDILLYCDVVENSSSADPLFLNYNFEDYEDPIRLFRQGLEDLGVAYNEIVDLQGLTTFNIGVISLVESLREGGWTQEAVQEYLAQLSTASFADFSINPYGIEVAQKYLDIIYSIPEEEQTEYDVEGDGEAALNDINDKWANVPSNVSTTYNVRTITTDEHRKISLAPLSQFYTSHVNGTAYKGGSWGAPQTETALVGELGPELRVRGNRWELLGENGTEFADVKKNDIIFNHHQTEQLLSNGHITGRGKAYAGGTAYASIDTWDDGYGKLNSAYSNTAGQELSEAAGDLSDAADEFKEVFDWIEVRIEEIGEDISLKSAKLENTVGSSKQNAIIDDMIALNQKLYNNLTTGAAKYNAYAKKLLEKVPAEYRAAAKDGSIAIETFTGEVGEETLEAIQNYREWVQKGADATQQAEETLTEISNLAKQAIDNIAGEYENKASIPGIKMEQLEAYNALIETTVGAESESIYKQIIKENNKQIKILQEQRNKMQAELNAQVEAGTIKKYSQNWYDAINDIAAVDTEIINLTTDTENYQDTINEMHWDSFDNLMSRFEAISDEAGNLIDILGSKDLVDKDTGEWTDEGITSLGLYAQQMEVAEMQANNYREEIDYLNKNWKKLGYTEQEYVEKLEELKNGQYDAIKAYNDTKDAIKDLTSERVDAIKDGIQKEIDAYEELISKKKEELDSERDLHDFQKGVADQQKEIADIERKLAALSADNSASARAQRAKLQAELADAEADLADAYYDRSITDQQNALDKSLESFQEEKDAEMEAWDEYLENTEQVVSDSLATIQNNTDVVYQTLAGMGQEYSLSIADALTSPWAEGETAIQNYSETFGLSMSATVNELKEVAKEYKKVMDQIENEGKEAIDVVNDNVSGYQEAEKVVTAPSGNNGANNDTPSSSGIVSGLSGNLQYGQSGSNVKKLQQALNDLGFDCGPVDGVFGYRTQSAVIKFQKSSKYGGEISADGIVGTNTKKKFKTAGYAKGTTGVQNSQFALIDELGEELVLRPSNGRLTFMEKGTGVVPADLTANLMEWGELDPSIMLEQNKPVISAPHVITNNIDVNMNFGEVVHIDTVTNDTIPNLTKAIERQMDKYMKGVNAEIRKYSR